MLTQPAMFKSCDFEHWLNFSLAKTCSVMCAVTLEAGTSTSSAPWRTISSKKHAELIGKAFGAPFLSCVKGLEDANSISDVLDAILAFSAAYVSQEQILRRVGEESDCEDGYFQNRQVLPCLSPLVAESQSTSC